MRHTCFLFASLWCFALVPSVGAQPVKTITLQMSPRAAISPLIYGVNYVWSAGSTSEFPSWLAQMQGSALASLIRFPGGWDGEWYDWNNNTLDPGGPTDVEPGVSPAEFLSAIRPLTLYPPLSPGWSQAMNAGGALRSASFQLPVRGVVEAGAQANIQADIATLVAEYLQIISQYHNAVEFWEFGNEWWLQNGAGANAAPLSRNAVLSENLTRYAEIIAAAAPAIKAAYPGIKLYVSADWRTAGAAPDDDEFVQLRERVGESAWSLIDGVSIHAYCGTNMQDSLCTSIPAQVSAIRDSTGKSDIFDSEWAVVRNQSTGDSGLRNANAMVSTFQSMALAGISEATYWPSIGFVPKIALTNGTALTATGILFQNMSQIYEGQAIQAAVSGPAGHTVAVAALNSLMGQSGAAVIIPTNGDGLETINLTLSGTGFTKIAKSIVICTDNLAKNPNSLKAAIISLPVTMMMAPNGTLTAQFILNPGTRKRGANWEIAALELQ